MASYGHALPAMAARPGGAATQQAYGGAAGSSSPAAAPAVAPPSSTPAAPAGTFAPGTKIQVGGHRVVIQKYLSEGGFAHVYLVRLPRPVDGTDLAVLKRVAVPDKDALRGMRTEVETMKRLRGHRAIVTYIDSHASELRGGSGGGSGGYEVFLLMEYCNGGGLIDFMNTRLQHRLTEPEILTIFADVAEGVACMHYLKPPLLHRDLKVENVLITTDAATKRRRYKVCDFGSAAPPRPAPTTVVECRLMDEDVQRHTTMQYRSPEMIDVYRKQPLDEKSDIWALGVLLYKLCYYTTPFEDQGRLAILNASYKFPSYPVFSDRLKKLIASMLKEHQENRPNIYQVLREACVMQGREVPIRDIYSARSQSEPRGNDRPPATDKVKSTPVVGAVFSAPPEQSQVIPEIVPMRRGRLPGAAGHLPSTQPGRSNPAPAKVTNGDPFAALDSKASARIQDVDELSSRFPTLDQFSILHDHGTAFAFDSPNSPPTTHSPQQKPLAQRVTEKLADDAFVSPPADSSSTVTATSGRIKPQSSAALLESQAVSPPHKSASAPPKSSDMSRASAIISSTPELQAISSQTSQVVAEPGKASKPAMVSTGTMTTSTPPLDRAAAKSYQIYRFPPADHDHRSASLPIQAETVNPGLLRADVAPSSSSSSSAARQGVLPRVPSFQSQGLHVRQPSSSRPSLEGRRPSFEYGEPMTKSISQTASSRPRPASTHLESNLDFLREREAGSNNKPLTAQGTSSSPRLSGKSEPDDSTNIESNVDFLRSMEEPDGRKDRHMRGKRASLTSGTKKMFAGKFGDAFKRFEASGNGPPPPRTPSPLKDLERQGLTPVTGSEATDGRSDDGEAIPEADDEANMSPEMRREVEKRRLEEEERRVAAAAAEYRERLARREQHHGGSSSGSGSGSSARGAGSGATGPTPLPKSIGGVSRALSIQNKVQSLLDESNRSSTGNVVRTAQGYGQYADAATTASRVSASPADSGRPAVARKPVAAARNLGGGSAAGASAGSGPGAGRPAAPPKPLHLNKALPPNPQRPASPPKPAALMGGSSSNKPAASATPARGGDQIVAVDLPGQPALDMSAQQRDDYIRDFAKRFPSLTSIEMVERDLAAEAEEDAAGGEAGR